MVSFRGSTQEKSSSEIFRFVYRKAANDKKVPDPVGSEEATRAKSASKESELKATNQEQGRKNMSRITAISPAKAGGRVHIEAAA
jgi:hypothetical protein